MTQREWSFIHRLHRPATADGSTLVLLHGTGGDETDLMPLAAEIAPQAVLLGARGRSNTEGVNRWFRRLSMTTFDQADIAAEASAFASFMQQAAADYELQADRTVFLGYSNGANLLGALMLLHPGLIRRAVLLRAMPVLDQPPQADLTQTEVLMINGSADPYGVHASRLETLLRANGARLDARTISAGHQLSRQDLDIVREWITSSAALAI